MLKLRVGILGAGSIAGKMAETINKMKWAESYAVASRDLEKAKKFAALYNIKNAYGSYTDMLLDKKIDLVYVATVHTLHYEHARMCIDHGKPVLVEKPFCVTADDAKRLLSYAKERNVFITEAMWTRYMPIREEIDKIVASGIIGEPKLLTANLGYEMMDKTRVTSPETAGGALVDVGIYPLNFAAMVFGHDIANVNAVCTYTETGVDAQDSITITYKDGRMAVLNSSMMAVSDRKGIIQGTKGFIIVENINNYESVTVYNDKNEKIALKKRPKQISGYEYEVEACRRAIGKKQLFCEEMPHEETMRMMYQLDQIRNICKIKYPFEK